MRFLGTVIVWIIASGVAYVCAALASQTIAMNEVAALIATTGAKLPMADRLSGTIDGAIGLWQMWPVIAVGFLVAFFVASLVKVVVPFLSIIAYPVAGAAAMAAILKLIPVAVPAYDGIPGTATTLGFLAQMAAGMIGGIVFERFRPR